jgi:hypothetical protein
MALGYTARSLADETGYHIDLTRYFATQATEKAGRCIEEGIIFCVKTHRAAESCRATAGHGSYCVGVPASAANRAASCPAAVLLLRNIIESAQCEQYNPAM